MQVDFGAVVVNAEPIRATLVATQRDLIARLGALVQTVPQEVVLAAARRYKELQAALLQKPATIEDVDAQRAMIDNLPNAVREVVEGLEAAQPWCAPHAHSVFDA